MRLKRRTGQGIIEYLLAIAVILLAIIAGVRGIGTAMETKVYPKATEGLKNAVGHIAL